MHKKETHYFGHNFRRCERKNVFLHSLESRDTQLNFEYKNMLGCYQLFILNEKRMKCMPN